MMERGKCSENDLLVFKEALEYSLEYFLNYYGTLDLDAEEGDIVRILQKAATLLEENYGVKFREELHSNL